MRARHWKGQPPCRALYGVKSWPTGLPEADDGADRDGDRNREIKTQSGGGRRMVKEKASQISPIQPI